MQKGTGMNLHYPLILASASPARYALLHQAGIPCIQIPTHADETAETGCPRDLTSQLAERKLESACCGGLDLSRHPVLSADTVAAFGSDILGKPQSRGEAEAYLRMLSGNTHEVVTSYCLKLPGISRVFSGTVSTLIRFHPLSSSELSRYLDRGEWEHAAGAYRIQGTGASFIQEISGSFWNVAGLPLEEIFGIVREQDCLHVVYGP